MKQTQRKIIYIMGAGRSGTTLLDIALGNAKGIFSCGELNRYPLRKGIPTGFKHAPERTHFWRRFTQKFEATHNLEEQIQLHRDFEYHSGLIKKIFGWNQKSKYKKYQQYLRDFHEELFDSIEEEVIVDSSKYPGRALAISESLSYEIGYVFIKRDPVGVVYSFAKKNTYLPSKGWFSANIYYLMVNVLCQYASRKLRKKHLVEEIKYEEFIQNPEKELTQIGEKLELDLSESVRLIQNDEFLKVGELFEGNTIRIDPEIKLRREGPVYPKNLKNGVTRMVNCLIYK
ncbi:MAG: sulfotransferase [Bacteroidetes bacterium]|nr:sulfotransferase [Bacteroidota bacterium]